MSQRKPEHEVDAGLISPDQKAIDRIFGLGGDLAADEQHHEHGDQRDAEKRREEHRERLGECQRPEEPALLSRKRKDRNKAYCDDQQ